VEWRGLDREELQSERENLGKKRPGPKRAGGTVSSEEQVYRSNTQRGTIQLNGNGREKIWLRKRVTKSKRRKPNGADRGGGNDQLDGNEERKGTNDLGCSENLVHGKA